MSIEPWNTGADGFAVREDMPRKSIDIRLMYGKEASNRKQEIDRQHHTIPNQRPKDKHYGKIKTFGFFHKSKLRRNPNFLQKILQIRIFTAKKFGFYF